VGLEVKTQELGLAAPKTQARSRWGCGLRLRCDWDFFFFFFLRLGLGLRCGAGTESTKRARDGGGGEPRDPVRMAEHRAGTAGNFLYDHHRLTGCLWVFRSELFVSFHSFTA
jgi:hypothetical protein